MIPHKRKTFKNYSDIYIYREREKEREGGISEKFI